MPKSHVSPFNPLKLQTDILDWYAINQRVLPWRVRGRGKTDPYKIWLSEIMLQQTTVAAVIPYFLKFLNKWTDVKALANAEDSEVMAAWAGLGYYARARNLLKCARTVASDYHGVFPNNVDELESLAGIGPYTAAAISTIAFGNAATVLDGNIERIVSRVFAIEIPLPQGKKDIRQHADFIFDGLSEWGKQDIQSYPQALMDIGAEICTPKAPKCSQCPVQKICKAHKNKEEEKYPVRLPKKTVPIRKGDVFWIQDKAGRVILEKRSHNRMLGGMIGLPTTDWDLKNAKDMGEGHFFKRKITNLKKIGVIYHVFTHFKLELDVYGVAMPDIQNMLKYSPDYVCSEFSNSDLSETGLPTVFLKAARIAQKFYKGY